VIRRPDCVKKRPCQARTHTRRLPTKSLFFSSASQEIPDFLSGIAGAG